MLFRSIDLKTIVVALGRPVLKHLNTLAVFNALLQVPDLQIKGICFVFY
jgi:hypothetical protein